MDLDVEDASHQAGYSKAVQLKASAQPRQEVHECVGVINWSTLLIIQCTKHPSLHIHDSPSLHNAEALPTQLGCLLRLRLGDQAGMSHTHYEVPHHNDLTAVCSGMQANQRRVQASK